MCQTFILLVISFSIQTLQAAHAGIKTKQAQEYEQGKHQKISLPERWQLDAKPLGVINKNKMVVLTTQNGLVVHDLKKGLYNSFEFIDLKDKIKGPLQACAMSDDGSLVAFADEQGNFGLAQGKDIRLHPQKVTIERLLFSPSGQQIIALIVTRGTGMMSRYHADVVAYDLQLNEIARIDLQDPTFKRPKITDLQINETGTEVAVLWSRKIKLWSIASNKLIQIPDNGAKCTSVMFTEGDNKGVCFLGIQEGQLNAYAYLYQYKDSTPVFKNIRAPIADADIKQARMRLINSAARVVLQGKKEQAILNYSISKSLEERFQWQRYQHTHEQGPFLVSDKLIVSYQVTKEKDKNNRLNYTLYFLEGSGFESSEPSGSSKPHATLKVTPQPFGKKNYSFYAKRGVACVLAFVAAYAAWRKFKKNKKMVSAVNALRKKRLAAVC